jgi:hypothetical protein
MLGVDFRGAYAGGFALFDPEMRLIFKFCQTSSVQSLSDDYSLFSTAANRPVVSCQESRTSANPVE